MSSCLLVFFAILSLFLAHIVQAQNSSAVCVEGYEWAFNSDGESPCDVAAKVMEPCRGEGYTVDALTPGASYWGPSKNPDTRCMCSTVTWAIFSACGICQNGTTISWNMWAYNCSNVTGSSPPLRAASQVDIPRWAYLDIGVDGGWNETAARADKALIVPYVPQVPPGSQGDTEDPPDKSGDIPDYWIAIIFSPLELLAALFILGIIFQVCRNIYWAIKRRISAVFERRRIKCAPELGNVTTELGTSPGEARSDP